MRKDSTTRKKSISKKDKITVETTSSQFIIRIALDGKKKTYSVDQDGRFTITDMTKK